MCLQKKHTCVNKNKCYSYNINRKEMLLNSDIMVITLKKVDYTSGEQLKKCVNM